MSRSAHRAGEEGGHSLVGEARGLAVLRFLAASALAARFLLTRLLLTRRATLGA
jgi:hypothetical protein